MDYLDNINIFGVTKCNQYNVKDIVTHSLVASNTTYTIALNGKMKHIIDLQNAPTNVTLDISGGADDVLMGVIVLKQSTTTVKNVTWNVNSNINFQDFSGAINTHQTYVFHMHESKYLNLASSSESINYRHLVYSGTTDVFTYINANQTIAKGGKDFIHIEYNNTTDNTKQLFVLKGASGVKYGKDDTSGNTRADLSTSNTVLISDIGGTNGGVLDTRSSTDNRGHRIAMGVSSSISTANPIVKSGEIVGESDTRRMKWNNTTSNANYNTLPYVNVYHDIIYLAKTLSTPTATTSLSLSGASYATLNITQNNAITFSDMKDGVVYSIIITQSGSNTVTFPNLLVSGGSALVLSGNTDVIQVMKNPSNTQAILLNKQLNVQLPAS